MARDLDALMTSATVIPVIVIDRIEHAVPLGRALVAGGLTVLEVTLRTPVALEAIRLMAREVEGAVVGAGTVLNAGDAERAREAGSEFLVSPGLTPQLAQACQALDVALLPGVSTAGEIMGGLELGLNRFKFFPAETVGGAPALKALAGPFGGVKFCPTGGISLASAPSYLALPNVLCVGGAWVAPKDKMEAGDWAGITELARQAKALKA
ncbi:MAG: bifunctional 4-hydroxy-2-oxoglutarate aldolase/2-dehydro-3-deoxy-phosphogluconate aldolase [Asticcacaulis sp.]